jgi:hypothetical protein
MLSLVDGVLNNWTVSGSGTNEYYYTGAGLSLEPAYVKINGQFATKATLGALIGGEYAWGDNDSLGADTLYVCLSDGADPDSKAAGYVRASVDDGTAPVFDADSLMVGTKEDPGGVVDREERYRSVIRFQQPTAPAWAALGPVSGVGASLLIVLDSASEVSSPVVDIGVIGSAWTASTTAAQFRVLGAAIGTWYDSTRLYGGHSSPQALYIVSLPGTAAHGYMIRVYGLTTTAGRMSRLATIPAPVLLRHYRYTATDAARVDATTRTALSATILSILNDRAEYRKFYLTLTIPLSERDPSLSDVTIAHVLGAPALISRRMNWPEAWLPDVPAAGGLPLSLVTDGAKVNTEDVRDAVLVSTLSVTDRTGQAHTVATQMQVIGDTIYGSDGRGELELRSPIDAVLSAVICNTHPLAPATVEYDTESAVTMITDLLLNSGKWLYSRFHYNDMAELLSRFAGVWQAFSLTSSDLSGLSVGDALELLGPAMGLCISQAADGCIDIWHPGVYRPSRKTHYFADTDCLPNGCTITDKGREGQFSGVTVTENSVSATAYQIDTLPVSDGWRENLETFELPTGIFETNCAIVSRYGLARQLMQRLCGRYYEITMTMALKGMAVDIGDTIVLTSAALGQTIPCLVTATETDPEGGVTSITAAHYPDYLGLHSTWENDGVLGIWRWLDSALDPDYTNHAHGTASDADFTLASGAATPAVNRLPGHWQGSCARFSVSNASPLLSDVAGVSDLFDVCFILGGDHNAPVGPTASWIDPDVGVVMAWVNADDSALALFWSVPDGSGSPSCFDNRLAIGYTADYTAATITWAWVYYLPYASIGRSAQISTDATALPSAVALEWQDTTLRIYVERRLMLTVTETEADKGDFASSTLYLGRGSSNYYMGCFRHVRQTGWVTELQRLQGANGIDPYYGPDSLT